MEPKQDYFRSPTPRNFQHFYSPFRLVRHDQDPLLINTLLSPFNRNASSYMSHLSPLQPNVEESQASEKVKKGGKFDEVLMFEGEVEGEEGELEGEGVDEEVSKNGGVETPQKNMIKIAHVDTTSRKKYDLRFLQSNEKVHYSRDGQRGLRALSKQAYEIFQHSQSMSYQEVAQKIIQQNQQLNEYPEKKKQRQSIKRRVYDALNVLIAVGILQKNGKRICLSRKMKEQNQKQSDTKKDLYCRLEDRARILEVKKKRLQKMREQKLCLGRLIARNQGRNSSKDQKISLPFVIARNPCSMRGTKQAVIHGFVCGDMDAISKLNINAKKH